MAQAPLPERGASRLMHVTATGPPRHLRFHELPSLLRAGDVLVTNDTRVVPARIRFRHHDRDAEILLVRPADDAPAEPAPDVWDCLVRPGRRMRPGVRLQLRYGLWADVVGDAPGGGKRLRFQPPGRLAGLLDEIGEMPLPPYIRTPLGEPDRYQTVYAREAGSAAAPTAGLHFDAAMLDRLEAMGVTVAPLTLRIGLDTFQPVRVSRLDDHVMHSESYRIPASTRAAISAAREAGGRVVAVGTTAARALEAAAAPGSADAGSTDLFIRPGFAFREVDLLLTNFHLPKSTLLVMVSAFAGRDRVLAAYAEAVAQGYRFYSFGDAMLIERAAAPA